MTRLKAGPPELTPAEVLGRFYPPSPQFWRNLRRQFRCSQTQMARRLGTSEDTYARWERAEAQPHVLFYVAALALAQKWPDRPAVENRQRKRRKRQVRS